MYSGTFQLDHFYPKDEFPMFAVSFYNLIPVCGTCNSIKNNTNFNIYPYLQEIKDNISFNIGKLHFDFKNFIMKAKAIIIEMIWNDKKVSISNSIIDKIFEKNKRDINDSFYSVEIENAEITYTILIIIFCQKKILLF